MSARVLNPSCDTAAVLSPAAFARVLAALTFTGLGFFEGTSFSQASGVSDKGTLVAFGKRSNGGPQGFR